MVEHFYVKFDDPSCSAFEISCGKTDTQTLLKTTPTITIGMGNY